MLHFNNRYTTQSINSFSEIIVFHYWTKVGMCRRARTLKLNEQTHIKYNIITMSIYTSVCA